MQMKFGENRGRRSSACEIFFRESRAGYTENGRAAPGENIINNERVTAGPRSAVQAVPKLTRDAWWQLI